MRVLLRLSPALIVIAVAIVGPWFTPYRIDESAFAPYAESGGGAVLGADQLGRDVLSRLLAGGRELLVTSTLIAVIVTALAALLGAVAALRPAVGRFIERTADMLIMLPVVLGMLLIVLAWPGSGQLACSVCLTRSGWWPPRPRRWLRPVTWRWPSRRASGCGR
jgi:peptide/nickel transport system permease protein